MSSSGWVFNASPEVNAQSQYPIIIGVCVGLTTLMVLTVGLRVYTRLKLVQAFGADDAIILVSMVFSIIYNALGIAQSRLGLGLPVALRPKESLDQYVVLNFAGRPFYQLGIAGFKIALCIAYLRISKHSSLRTYRIWIWGVLIFTVLTHIAGTLALIFACTPISRSWQPSIPGTCLPNDTFFYVLAATSIFCDLLVFITPIPLLLRLRINLRRKLGLIAVFTLGMFTTVCSVMRMVQIIQITKDGNSTGLVLWGTIELNVGIALTCLPTLAPLFTFFRSDSAVNYRFRSGGNTAGTGARSGKRSSRLPTGLTNRSIGGTTTLGTAHRSTHAKRGGDGGSENSLETILPVQHPEDDSFAKSVEDGYILRSVDISVTRQSPGPNEPMQGSPIGAPPVPHAL